MRAERLLWLVASVAATVSMAGCSALSPLEYHKVHAPGAAPETRLEQATFQQAQALIAEQRYEEALRRLAPLAPAMEKAEDWNRAAAVFFWMAYCHEKQGRLPQAIDLYRHVTAIYSATPAARQAGERLALLAGPAEAEPKPPPPPTDKT